ncbi:MAG: zinc ribbon domain-containing protein, partial [Methanoculleus sp.]|nr:zinc ribbon domain-containing protein [Methanoculleus sp.]
MSTEEHFGTEADGTLSKDYCANCYQNGAFTEPGITIDEMAVKCSAILSQLFCIPAANAERFAREQMSCLKRWTGREIPACGSCGMPLA